jgi:hypothetical protein
VEELSAHPDLAHLPAEPGICDRNNRSWRSRTAIRRASCSRPGLDRASCRVRHQGAGGIPCRLIEPSHRLPPYRSSYRTDRRAVHGRCVPIPSLAHRSRRRQLEYGRSTTFTVSVEGITETEAAGIHKLCTTIAIAQTRQANWLYCTSAMNNPLKNHDPRSSAPPADASASRPWRTRLQWTTGQCFENAQRNSGRHWSNSGAASARVLGL